MSNSNSNTKSSLVVTGPDKYSNPHAYKGESKKNFVQVEVNKDKS